MPQKKCSKCGAVFQCGCDALACWCQQLAVKPETLNHLKNMFNNCLCENCLEQYSVNKNRKLAFAKRIMFRDTETSSV